MSNLFAYGTLMCEDIMESVAGVLPEKKQGVLVDHRRLKVADEHFPGVIEKSGGCIEGVVYLDISEQSWKRLDGFEGDMYSRKEVVVQLDDGSGVVADTYIVKGEHVHRLEDADWDFDRFLERGKGAFVAYYSGYDEID